MLSTMVTVIKTDLPPRYRVTDGESISSRAIRKKVSYYYDVIGRIKYCSKAYFSGLRFSNVPESHSWDPPQPQESSRKELTYY